MLLGLRRTERRDLSNKEEHIQNPPVITDRSRECFESASSHKSTLRELFDDLSIAQVIAGALAAATVFFLSSTIGWAGSLIGAAIGSVVSAISSQVYKKMLSASADKIRDKTPATYFGATGDADQDQVEQDGAVQGAKDRSLHDGETQALLVSDADKTMVLPVPEVTPATLVMDANDVRYRVQQPSDDDPALRRAQARRNRKARYQRRVLIVSIVSALIAIAISSLVIVFATAGEGIGSKPQPIISSQVAQSQSSSTAVGSDTGATSDQSTSTSDKGSSSDQSGSSSDNSSTDGTGGSGSGDGTTGDSSGTGSGDSGDQSGTGSGSGSDSGGDGGTSGSEGSGTGNAGGETTTGSNGSVSSF